MAFYRRNLPHWQPDYAQFFVTFRLANSLPKSAIRRIKYQKKLLDKQLQKGLSEEQESADRLSAQRKYFQQIFDKYEEQLEHGNSGPTWLAKPSVADIVSEAIHHRDNRRYDLYAYCIMPNHVHIILKMLEANIDGKTPILTKTLQKLKSFTALQANKQLNRSGSFWQAESFDRVIRDNEELESTIKYVIENPVKANLVERWQDWSYSYCKTEFKRDLL